MKRLSIGDVTITSIIERDGPWRTPQEMFPAYDPIIGKRHVAELDSAPLDAREREVLSMVALGLHNREIGEQLGLTEGTVKWYLQRIFDKLGIRRRTQAVHRAKQYGLLA